MPSLKDIISEKSKNSLNMIGDKSKPLSGTVTQNFVGSKSDPLHGVATQNFAGDKSSPLSGNVISNAFVGESQNPIPGALQGSEGSEHAFSKSNFIGQTPNLNSSLGVNAVDGTDPSDTKTTAQKITDFAKTNENFLLGLGSTILGGSSSSSNDSNSNPGQSPESTKKKILGMHPALFYGILAIIFIIILVIVIKKMRKK